MSSYLIIEHPLFCSHKVIFYGYLSSDYCLSISDNVNAADPCMSWHRLARIVSQNSVDFFQLSFGVCSVKIIRVCIIIPKEM